MAKIDLVYADICEKIFENGRAYENKNRGVERLQIPSYTLRHSFNDGFPALTNKKLFFRGIVGELEWFLNGKTNVKPLIDNKNVIWNDDAYNWYVKHAKGNHGIEANNIYHRNDDGSLRMFSKEEFVDIIKNNDWQTLLDNYTIDRYTIGDVGKNYSHQWRRFGEIDDRKIKLVQPTPILDRKYAVSYLGVANGEGKERHFLKKTWEGMISRCYDKNNISYPLYGGKGVYVCNKWLSFQGFLEDIIKINGYDLKEASPEEYSLDKDILGNGYVYDIDSCQFVTNAENTNQIHNIKYVLEKDGFLYEFNNIARFCREQNLPKDAQKNLSKLWTQGAKSSYGFKFVSRKNMNEGTDQIVNLIQDMMKDIMSSRLKVNAWNPAEIFDTTLPPCHSEFQIIGVPLTTEEMVYYHNVEAFYGGFSAVYIEHWDKNSALAKGRDVRTYLIECGHPEFGFELHWNQRSVDTFLGLPFNIASYGLFAKFLEAVTGYPALGIEGTLKCVHFYDNAYEGAKELISRDPNKHKNCKLARIEIDRDKFLSDIAKGIQEFDFSQFKLEGYTSDEAIKVDMIAPKEA